MDPRDFAAALEAKFGGANDASREAFIAMWLANARKPTERTALFLLAAILDRGGLESYLRDPVSRERALRLLESAVHFACAVALSDPDRVPL